MSSINVFDSASIGVVGRGQTSFCHILRWYALRIQSKAINTVYSTLCSKGYETFLPLCATRQRWSDRVKEVQRPLFPGYLFCKFDVRNRLPILITPGVITVVGAGKVPIAVEDEEIAAIRAVLCSGLAATPRPFLSTGTKVCILSGPLAGVEGILTESRKSDRLVVSVQLLQRSVSVEVAHEWIVPVDTRRTPSEDGVIPHARLQQKSARSICA